MAAGAPGVDELIREYLLFRGFTNTLRTFETEIKNDKDKSFRVSVSRNSVCTSHCRLECFFSRINFFCYEAMTFDSSTWAFDLYTMPLTISFAQCCIVNYWMTCKKVLSGTYTSLPENIRTIFFLLNYYGTFRLKWPEDHSLQTVWKCLSLISISGIQATGKRVYGAGICQVFLAFYFHYHG